MKKIMMFIMVFCISQTFIFAASDNISVYTVETESEIIIDQLYENKNVETYKFIIENAIEDGCINITYSIDDQVVRNDNNILVFQEKTSYFFIGTTPKHLFLRPDKKNKRFVKGKVDVSSIDEGFVYAMKNVGYIIQDKSMIRNDDLIMRFENVYNDHNYKIEFKYNVATE